MTQTEALTILKTGKNVFVTGAAGSGKTYVINQYIKYLKSHNIPIGITASTGIAATHMGGVTIHSWTGIGISDSLSDFQVDEIAEKKYVKTKIEAAKVLIIDEVSMLHHFRLDMVDQVLRRIKKSEKPFGGIQVVLCGDFFQLPPISRFGEPQSRFIYESSAWKHGKFTVCYLGDNYRQVNDPSLDILNDIRSGEVSEQSYELLMSRSVGNISGRRESAGEDGGESEDGDSEDDSSTAEDSISTKLYTHNIDVDSMNDGELIKMSGYESIYEMMSKGKKPLVEALKKSCLAPEKLRLKKGARVICVKNNFDEGYVNGTLGVIVSCGFGIDPVIHTASTPDHPEGRRITIAKATWAIEDSGKILAEITQYPLRLAWAITVHKSQGMSLDSVEVDLSKSFEPGMGYVALSRVRTLAGLKILGINETALRVNPFVLEYDRHLKDLSAKAESVIQNTDSIEIENAHKEFLAVSAPLHKMKKSKEPAYKFPKEAKKTKKPKSRWNKWSH
ncbi:MAG: PIF1 family DEAD/DEAH box helicase [Candidatus Taylorbacteria bacterium]